MLEAKKEDQQTDLIITRANRFEVIDHSKSFEQGGGRVFVKKDCKSIEISYQDDGRTVKIFIK